MINDNGCPKHMTGRTKDFLSLKTLYGGSVFFGNRKKGNIEGVSKTGKSPNHSIEYVYFVNGLKYSLLSLSQICGKGNTVKFLLDVYIVTNLSSTKVLKDRRCNNKCKADSISV